MLETNSKNQNGMMQINSAFAHFMHTHVVQLISLENKSEVFGVCDRDKNIYKNNFYMYMHSIMVSYLEY